MGRLGLLLASLAVCALAGEAILRALASEGSRPDHPRFDVFRSDAVLGYALRPDWTAVKDHQDFRMTVHTNALGLRGAAASPVPGPGVARLLVVGDSFTFGWGVDDDETFVARLDALLGPGVEVLGAGAPGWSADHYWLFLMDRGFALEPDVLVVATCSNDVGELGWSALELGPGNLPVRSESRRWLVDHRGRLHHTALDDLPLPRLPLGELAGRSHLASWLRYRMGELWVAWAERAELERESPEPPPPGPVEALAPAQVERALARSRRFRHRYYRHLLRAIGREARARGIAVRTLHVGPGRSEESRECRAAGRTCLDVTELFSRESDPAAFHPHDGHWTARGHARVARALAAWLRADPELGLARAQAASTR